MYDALMLAAIVDELNDTILDGKVQRVLLLDPLTIGFEVYAGRRYQLLVSADAREPLRQALAIAQRGFSGLQFRSLDAHALRRFSFDLADRLLKRQPLAGDVALLKRRLDAAQLTDERNPRAVVQSAAVLACVFIQATNSPGNQGIIISHCALFAGA